MKKNKLVRAALVMLPMLLLSLWSFGQTVTVQGTVTDQDGGPLPGVNIIIKGTTVGVVSDMNGKYQIETNSESTLSFSFIGFLTQDVPVAGKTEVNVKLVQGDLQMDEVVVVGYGTIKKTDISGAVASVNSETMMRKAPTNILQGLKGAAAGVMELPRTVRQMPTPPFVFVGLLLLTEVPTHCTLLMVFR